MRQLCRALQLSTLLRRRFFAIVALLMSLTHSISTLDFPPAKVPISAVTSASREACAGMRARYICDADNPAMFHICLGLKRFTMICPGELHFSERTQTCDWPEIANCHRLSRVQSSKPPPPMAFYNSTVNGFDSTHYEVAFEPKKIATKDKSLSSEGRLYEKESTSKISKTQQRKRRYRIRKQKKDIGMISSLAKWWNEPAVTSPIPHTIATTTSKYYRSNHKGNLLQPYKADIISQTSSNLGFHVTKDSKISKPIARDIFKRTFYEGDVQTKPHIHGSAVKIPWYRPINIKSNGVADFSPSLSFKNRTSRESRLTPRKPVVISPFKPFIRKTNATPHQINNKHFQKASSAQSKRFHSTPPESPMSQWHYSLNDGRRFASLHSNYLEKGRSSENRRGVYTDTKFLDRSPQIHSKLKNENKSQQSKDHIDQDMVSFKNSLHELDGSQQEETEPFVFKDFGSLTSAPNNKNKFLRKSTQNGVGNHQPSNLRLKQLNEASEQKKPISHNRNPYQSIVYKSRVSDLQEDSSKSTMAAHGFEQDSTMSKGVGNDVYNEWTSLHGVAGIPDYNPAQALGYYTTEDSVFHEDADIPRTVSTNRLGKQSTERQNDMESNLIHKATNIPNRGIQYPVHSKHKNNVIDSSRHYLGKVTDPYRSDLRLAKLEYRDKSKGPSSIDGKYEDFPNLIISTVNRAASKAEKTPKGIYTEKENKLNLRQVSEQLKKTSFVTNRAEKYSRPEKRQWRHYNLPMFRSHRQSEITPNYGLDTPKTHNDTRLRNQNERRYHKSDSNLPYPVYSQEINNFEGRKHFDGLRDGTRNTVFQRDQPLSTSKNQKMTRKTLPAAKHFFADTKQSSVEVDSQIPEKGAGKHDGTHGKKTPQILHDDTRQFSEKNEGLGSSVSKRKKRHHINYPDSWDDSRNQRPKAKHGDRYNSQSTKSSDISLQGRIQDIRQLSNSQKAPQSDERTHQKAESFSELYEEDTFYRKTLPQPIKYYTPSPSPRSSRDKHVQRPLDVKDRARSRSTSYNGREEGQSFPATLSYALHGLGGPQRSQRTYALHKPNHRNFNRMQLPIETKRFNHYSLYGLKGGSKKSTRDGNQRPVPLKDSRFQLQEEKTKAGGKESQREEMVPRTSPVEKYKTTRAKCSRKWCKLPYCRCVGTDIPGGLDVEEIPQMVMLTFDDSINIQNINYYRRLFNGTLRNPNGCPIKGTFFVSGDNTDYKLVTEVYRLGQEIASHTISHRSPTTWWAYAGYDNWEKEVVGMRKRLHQNAGVPIDEIAGMRAPFLQVGGDAQYAMLAENNFRYDTSMVTGDLHSNRKSPIWPFTLDAAPNSQTCSLTPCPKRSYPGLWEVPLVRWYGSNNMACAMPDACTIGAGTKGSLRFLEENFKRHYKRNKAPLGIFIHASWFGRQHSTFEGLAQFLDLMSHMGDVWVVSVSQALDWIQNPVPISRLDSLKSWGC